jgi:glycosyltransferase involved in cell wall biosynthesis
VFLAMHNFLPVDAPLWRRLIWKSRLQLVSRLPGLNIFVSNQHTKNAMRGWVSEKFWQRVKVAVTGVDPVQLQAAAELPFDAAATRAKHGIAANDFVVLSVGQFIDRKGRWIFLDAARQILLKHKDVSFVWLMPSPPDESEKKRIADFELGDKFHIVLSENAGRNRLEVLSFFRIADIFALASYVEGIPGAMLEAMSLGLPSISTNVYGIPEALKDRETGLLIPPGDSKALADAILELKNDDELRSRIGRQGREYVRENFDDRATARIVIDEYTEALKRAR